MSLAAGSTTLDYAQLESAWISGGGDAPSAPLAAAVATAESGGQTGDIGDESVIDGIYAPSYGLWQIRSVHRDAFPNFFPPSSEWMDPVQNASAAVNLANHSNLGWGNWSTYNDGAYQQYVNPAVPPAPGNQPTAGDGTPQPPPPLPMSGLPPGAGSAIANAGANVTAGVFQGFSQWMSAHPIGLLLVALGVIAIGLFLLLSSAQSQPAVQTAEKAAAAA